MKKKYLLILSASSLAIFLFFMFGVIFNWNFLIVFDTAILGFLQNNRNDFFSFVFTALSILGNTLTIFVLTIIFLLLPNRKKLGIPLGIATGISAILNFIIKYFVQRSRPVGFAPNFFPLGYTFPTSPSFPSGHSQTAIVFYFILTMLICANYIKNKKNKATFIVLTTIFCFFIAFSRIYLGVHFPTDILAGLMLGIFVISLFLYFYKNYSLKKT